MNEPTKYGLMAAIETIAEATRTPNDVIIEALTGIALDEEDAGNLKAAFELFYSELPKEAECPNCVRVKVEFNECAREAE